jgi:hypothetical protein
VREAICIPEHYPASNATYDPSSAEYRKRRSADLERHADERNDACYLYRPQAPNFIREPPIYDTSNKRASIICGVESADSGCVKGEIL